MVCLQWEYFNVKYNITTVTYLQNIKNSGCLSAAYSKWASLAKMLKKLKHFVFFPENDSMFMKVICCFAKIIIFNLHLLLNMQLNNSLLDNLSVQFTGTYKLSSSY